ncbi:uracil-DNA glycosylase family protein [Namhaeicola litoreus]|uniref:Uracil-DNA glycosylase family protein n=1 Tax=Namhaeicola litoreus TaxID=1052145 RepID=A0ABW3XZF9_9FLAO
MIFHRHPYPVFLPIHTDSLIVGTLPPYRFSVGQLFEDDVDFCYGSKYGLLWPILNEIFHLELSFENNESAIYQRKSFLQKNRMGICDIVDSCEREKIDASDLGMKNIKLRNLVQVLEENTSINRLLLMGGMSLNGPGYLLKKHLQSHNIPVSILTENSIKTLEFSINQRKIKAYMLISPSSAANRAIGNTFLYKLKKSNDPNYSVMDFRIAQYKLVFLP